MRLCEHSITLEGSLESAWAMMVDWQTMPDWDIFMESLHFDGPLALGSVGKLKMKNGPQAPLTVTTFNAPISYTDELSLYGTRLTFYHELREKAEGKLEMRFTVDGAGLLASLFGTFMAKDMKSKMPVLMNNFKRIYEEHERKKAGNFGRPLN